LPSFRPSVDRHFDAFVDDLRRFIETESPTIDKAACDLAGRHFAERFHEYAGAEIVWHRQERQGDHFEARVGHGGRKILLLGHFDTVWPVGTIGRLPCRIERDRLTGPGSFDMKYGDIQALWTPAAAAVTLSVRETATASKPLKTSSERTSLKFAVRFA